MEEHAHPGAILSEGGAGKSAAAGGAQRRKRHPLAKIKGGWTQQEDAELIRLVAELGEGNWSPIARALNAAVGKDDSNGRIGKQCRERWNHHLRPDIKKDAWTRDEEHLLVKAHQELGNRWSDIAKTIPGRSENAVKNHWNATLRRRDLPDPDPGPLKIYMQGLNLIKPQARARRGGCTTAAATRGKPSKAIKGKRRARLVDSDSLTCSSDDVSDTSDECDDADRLTVSSLRCAAGHVGPKPGPERGMALKQCEEEIEQGSRPKRARTTAGAKLRDLVEMERAPSDSATNSGSGPNDSADADSQGHASGASSFGSHNGYKKHQQQTAASAEAAHFWAAASAGHLAPSCFAGKPVSIWSAANTHAKSDVEAGQLAAQAARVGGVRGRGADACRRDIHHQLQPRTSIAGPQQLGASSSLGYAPGLIDVPGACSHLPAIPAAAAAALRNMTMSPGTFSLEQTLTLHAEQAGCPDGLGLMDPAEPDIMQLMNDIGDVPELSDGLNFANDKPYDEDQAQSEAVMDRLLTTFQLDTSDFMLQQQQQQPSSHQHTSCVDGLDYVGLDATFPRSGSHNSIYSSYSTLPRSPARLPDATMPLVPVKSWGGTSLLAGSQIMDVQPAASVFAPGFKLSPPGGLVAPSRGIATQDATLAPAGNQGSQPSARGGAASRRAPAACTVLPAHKLPGGPEQPSLMQVSMDGAQHAVVITTATLPSMDALMQMYMSPAATNHAPAHNLKLGSKGPIRVCLPELKHQLDAAGISSAMPAVASLEASTQCMVQDLCKLIHHVCRQVVSTYQLQGYLVGLRLGSDTPDKEYSVLVAVRGQQEQALSKAVAAISGGLSPLLC